MVIKSNEIKTLGKSPDKLTVAQIKVLLALLKCRGNKVLPSNKVDLLTRLTEWEENVSFLEEAVIDDVVEETKQEERTASVVNEINSDSEEFGETELM